MDPKPDSLAHDLTLRGCEVYRRIAVKWSKDGYRLDEITASIKGDHTPSELGNLLIDAAAEGRHLCQGMNAGTAAATERVA